MNEQRRRSRRKAVESVIQVVNAMTGATIGRIGNLSIDGMMVIANLPLREDALYQFIFNLPDPHGHPVPIEVGVHEQWIEHANAPGQHWAGFRIIDINARDYDLLKAWVERGEAR